MVKSKRTLKRKEKEDTGKRRPLTQPESIQLWAKERRAQDKTRLLETCRYCAGLNARVYNYYYSWGAYYCTEHQMFLCMDHYRGHTDLHLRLWYESTERLAFLQGKKKDTGNQAEQRKQEEAEMCKMLSWADDLDLKMFHCAECGQSCCECTEATLLKVLFGLEPI